MAKVSNLLSEELIDSITEYIDQEQLQAHDMIPSERRISQMFGVSRGSVREAVNKMSLEGMLYTVQGKGSFISPEKQHLDMKDFISFSESVRAQNKEPAIRLVKMEVQKAGIYEARKLQIQPEEEIHVITRVRMIDGEIVLMEISCIPVSSCPDLGQYDLGAVSLYQTLEEKYNIKPVRQDISVKISRATREEAHLLDILEYDPVFVEKGVALDEKGIPVEYTKSVVNAARAKYTIDIQ